MQNQSLIEAYNATSTIDPNTGENETIQAWLERQLLSRIDSVDKVEKKRQKFFKATVEMRFAQKKFFKTKRQEYLILSKKCEKIVDDLISLEESPELFT